VALIDLAAPLAALFTVILVVWGVYALFAGEGAALRRRIGQYGGGQATVQTAARSAPLLKDRSFSTIGALDRLLSGRGYAERAALDLARAAVPLRVGEYLLIRWLAAAGLFLLVNALRVPWPLALAFGVLGFFLPRFYVSRRERARIRKIDDQLVDTLTMMSNSLKSGSSFLQAMELVSRELPPPIAHEFAQVVAEVGVGAPIDQALADLARRVRSYDVYLMITAMTVQRTVGGNLSEVLQNIAHTIRERQRLLRQVQVETAEQRISAYILMALPTALLIIIAMFNRQYLDPLFSEAAGRAILVAALVMQIIGYFIMRRIADIKV